MASESLKSQIRSRCVHFNGVQNKTCEAGISYDSVRVAGQGFPCLRGKFDKHGEELACNTRRWPTEEEIAAECEEADRDIAETLLALDAINKDAAQHGYKKGNGGTGEVACPVCSTGKLRYRVAGYNGHRAAKCSTDGCVCFME